MSIFKKPLKLKIIYWPKIGDTDYGKPSYGDPVPLKGRWDDNQEEVIMPDGRKVVSKSLVMLSADVKAGGILFLVSYLPSDPYPDPLPPAPPTQINGGQEILRFQHIGNIRQRKFVRLATV